MRGASRATHGGHGEEAEGRGNVEMGYGKEGGRYTAMFERIQWALARGTVSARS